MLGCKSKFLILFFLLGLSSELRAGVSPAEYEFVTRQLMNEFAADIAKVNNGRGFQIRYDLASEVAGTANHLHLIVIGGGYKNIQQMNRDALTLQVCFEIGRILGGAPFVVDRSVVGQADYFATSKCLPRAWKLENSVNVIRRWVYPKEFVIKCSQSFAHPARVAVCIRSAIAAQMLALTLHQTTPNIDPAIPEPNYKTPDPHIENSGVYTLDYPSNQCRLDTMLAGSYCNVNPYVPVNIASSTLTGCPKGNGARPLCWFQPEVNP